MDERILTAAEEFALGDVAAVDTLDHGDSAVVVVTTRTGTFVLKRFAAPWQAELYDVVQHHLNQCGVRQARLLRAADQALISRAGYTVQEHLPGEVVMFPSNRQRCAVFRHLARYHSALSDVPVPDEVTACSLWTQTASPEWLLRNLNALLERYLGPTANVGAIDASLALMTATLSAMAALPVQLVHGDIGPDNVLLGDDGAVTVVDFTPYRESPLFALSSALYWYHVHGQPDGVDLVGLRSSAEAFAEERPYTRAELSLLPAMLARESLRRLAIPLAVAEAEHQRPGDRTSTRFDAAVAVAISLPNMQTIPLRHA